jgi:hypothetical protein
MYRLWQEYGQECQGLWCKGVQPQGSFSLTLVSPAHRSEMPHDRFHPLIVTLFESIPLAYSRAPESMSREEKAEEGKAGVEKQQAPASRRRSSESNSAKQMSENGQLLSRFNDAFRKRSLEALDPARHDETAAADGGGAGAAHHDGDHHHAHYHHRHSHDHHETRISHRAEVLVEAVSPIPGARRTQTLGDQSACAWPPSLPTACITPIWNTPTARPPTAPGAP